ncbi:MAG: polymer-forming cytoskeletal protein [Rickettsiales bacterium]|nr:polymer-forming cytoskeletal protein [Rickettsiales bacterium]
MFQKTSSSPSSSNGKGTTPALRKQPPTVIAADVNMLGNIISEGALDIDGRIEGNIKCKAITIRKNGAIIGDVIADSVQVYGRVKGLIKSSEVHLFATAHVEGVIMHNSLSIEDGAFVDGQFKRAENTKQDSVMSDAEMDILQNLKLIS